MIRKYIDNYMDETNKIINTIDRVQFEKGV